MTVIFLNYNDHVQFICFSVREIVGTYKLSILKLHNVLLELMYNLILYFLLY